MSVYKEKLLELLSIENVSDQTFLRVKITADEDIELLWHIDSDTTPDLLKIISLNNKLKYRLSLQCSWDSNENRHISYITKTYRETSEKIHFCCSQQYIEQLSSIKKLEKVNDIARLPFLSPNLAVREVENLAPPLIEQHSNPLENKIRKKLKNNRLLVLVATITIIFAITAVARYSDSLLVNFSANTTVEAKTDVKTEKVENKKISTPSISDSSTTISPPQPSTPFVELDNLINYSIPEGTVAITFDDGPTKRSKAVVDILKQYNVGATFFFTGYNIKKHPEMVKYVHTNGYSIGNHSMSHKNFVKLSPEKQLYEIMQTSKLIEEIISDEITLFRPPYGEKNEVTTNLIKKLDQKMVLWNNDPKDWKWDTNNSNEILHYIKHNKNSGAIILLHESQATIDVLPEIIEYLQKQNLRIVSLK